MSKYIYMYIMYKYMNYSKIMFTQCSALTPDFSQNGNTRAVSQYMGNKVTGFIIWKSNSDISF